MERMIALSAPAMAVFRRPVILPSARTDCKHNGTFLYAETLFGHCNAKAVTVACGRRHMVLVDGYGRAWSSGIIEGAGIADVGSISWPDSGISLVSSLTGVRLTKVACGNDHAVALTVGGDVFTWGRALGDDADSVGSCAVVGVEGSVDQSSCVPRATFAGADAVDIAAGEAHVAVVTLAGDVYVWGQNHHGQCGRSPDHVTFSAGTGRGGYHFPVPGVLAGGAVALTVARRVACGRYHTAVLTAEGAVYTFGAGMSGQLGRTFGERDAPPCWDPSRVTLETDESTLCAPVVDRAFSTKGGGRCVVQIACGDEHTICLTDGGVVLAFGSGDEGQLGLGGVRSHRLPVVVRTLGVNIRDVAAGGTWSLFRGAAGEVYQAGRACSDDGDCRLLRLISSR